MKPVLVALLALVVACVASQRCPCGQEYDRDPLDPDGAFYVSSDHDASAHCYCRCGDGAQERFPPSQTCAGYEGACERSDGTIAQLTCE